MTDSDLMNYLVRMVIPIKREFGRTLDVQKFLIDRPYAVEVIHEAMQSHDPRLQEYAVYVQGKVFGPRSAGGRPAPAARQPDPVSAIFRPESTGATTEDLHKKRLDKYKTGLR
jgi:hypothetical protein